MLKEVDLITLASIAKSTKVKQILQKIISLIDVFVIRLITKSLYGLSLRIDYNTNLYRLGIGLELEVKLELVHMENEPNELKRNFFF